MISGLVSLIIVLLVLGILVAVAFYVIDAIPIPDPIGRFIKIGIIVVAALAIVIVLMKMLGVDTGVSLPELGG